MLTTHKDFKIELVNSEECKDFFLKWGTFASTCYASNKKYAKKIGKVCFESGHNSGSRAFHFIFDITDVPRSLVDQLVRHDIGVVKNVQSFRYVKKSGSTVYVPNLIAKDEEMAKKYREVVENSIKGYEELVTMLEAKGFKGEKANEQARGVIPMNTNTGLTIGFTYEALVHLANERLCTRAEYPIRMLVKQMVVEVLKVLPELQDKLVAKCITAMYCDEDKCCGIRPPKAQLEKAIHDRMSPTKVYDNIMNGIPMRLPEWEGYWVSPNGKDIFMYCKDGQVTDIRHTTDTKYTLDHLFKRFDWIEAK